VLPGKRQFYEASFRICLYLKWLRLAAISAARASTADLQHRTHPGRSVLISGLGRAGKTLLAKRLCREFGYQSITTDDSLEYFFAVADYFDRYEFRRTFYADILKRWPTGLLIEGDDFILENRAEIAALDHNLDPGFARTLSMTFDVPLIFLGNAETTIDEKLDAFRTFSRANVCWTTSLFEDEGITINEYAAWLIRVSGELKKFADGRLEHYYELDGKTFESSLQEAAGQIAGLVGIFNQPGEHK
jgi:hypothetical protein